MDNGSLGERNLPPAVPPRWNDLPRRTKQLVIAGPILERSGIGPGGFAVAALSGSV